MSSEQPFLVDLRGVVDVLSHHLYSSPRIYLREVLQNAMDAITARAAIEPACPRRITITPADVSADGCLHVVDTGIGLDDITIRSALATIGGSTKREELEAARNSFLGQFGIGILSGFMVSNEIVVITRRSSEAGGDGRAWTWVGREAGTYRVTERDDRAPHLGMGGTEVILRPSQPGVQDLLNSDAVIALASDFGAYLPAMIEVITPAGPLSVSAGPFPWEITGMSDDARRAASHELCESMLGFTPMAIIDLDDPATGTQGCAFVTPEPSPRSVQRVYARGMLVGDLTDLLPDWAVFVRTVANTQGLALTASREALSRDAQLFDTQERLGNQITAWLLGVAGSDSTTVTDLFAVHHVGVKAMAVADDRVLDVVADLVPWESTVGTRTLRQFALEAPTIDYANRIAEYRQMSPIAQAEGRAILNAGYAHDDAIIRRFVERHPDYTAHHITPPDLIGDLDQVEGADSDAMDGLLESARSILAEADCTTAIRRFAPSTLAAAYFTDASVDRGRDRIDVTNAAVGPWRGALESLANDYQEPTFVLNSANESVQRLAVTRNTEARALAIEALYVQALAAGGHLLRPFDRELLVRSVPGLIGLAIEPRAR